MTAEPSEYESHEFEVILNYVHHALCNLDRKDRKKGRKPKWQSLEDIVKQMKGFGITLEVWYLADYMLQEERGLIERHPKDFRVRLTKEGRNQCDQRLTEP
ncbi:MAG: hypothetical protein ACRD8W_04180 [Nitrososphaeraceae archaeon]